MQEVAAVRDAALDATDDVEPAALYERIVDRLESGSMAPGVLTVLSARAADRAVDDRDDPVRPDAIDGELPLDVIARRGAGVQLIYEGLALTRTLSHEHPWTAPDESDDSIDGDRPVDTELVATNGAGIESDIAADADMAILVADVLVARGFYLLARTEAASAAVEVVRSFGRDETIGRTTGENREGALEADVFELAAVAGTTAVGSEPTRQFREHVVDLLGRDRRLPDAAGLFSETTVDALAGLVTDERRGAGDGDVATSADS